MKNALEKSAKPLLGRPCAQGIFILLAVPLALHFNTILLGEVPWFMDITTQFFPFRMHAAELLAEGQLPLWNRTLFGGVPFLANPQWGLLYPGHWPLFLFPGPRTFSLINIAHIAFMGVGIFAWLRRALPATPSGRPALAGPLAAGLLAQLGGWTWAHLAFGSYLQVAAWTPWMFLAFESIRNGDRKVLAREQTRCAPSSSYSSRPWFTWGLAAGVMGAMQWLAGAPQMALYCQSALILYALLSWLILRPAPSFRALMGFLFIESGAAIGLSAPQWMCTRAFLAECERSGGLPVEQLAQGALDLAGFAKAWIGGTGNPEDAEQILYPGYIAIFFCFVAILTPLFAWVARLKSRSSDVSSEALPDGRATAHTSFNILPAILVILAVSATAWKTAVPFFHHYLPLYASFHDPKRILFIAYLFTLFLAGAGIQALFNQTARIKRQGLATWGRGGLGLLVILACAEVLFFVHNRIDIKTVPLSQFYDKAHLNFSPPTESKRFFAYDAGIQYSYNYTRSDFAYSLLPNLGSLHGLEDIQGYDPFILWRYGLAMRRLNSLPVPAPTLYPSHFGLVRNLDSPWLSRFGPLLVRGPVDCQWPLLPNFQAVWIAPGEKIRIDLASQRRPWNPKYGNGSALGNIRAYVTSLHQDGKALDNTLLLTFQNRDKIIASLRLEALSDPKASIDPFALSDNRRLWPDVLEPRSENLPPGLTHPRVHRARVHDERVLEPPLQNIDSILVANPGATSPVLLYSLGLPREPKLFQNFRHPETFRSTWTRDFPAKIELLTLGVRTPEERKLYEEIALSYSPDRVQIELPPGLAARPKVPTVLLEGWSWREKKANRLAIDLPADHSGGWLVLSEAFAPGWSAQVDSKAAPIYPADTLFRAIPIPAGAKSVTMRYIPPGLIEGLFTALATLFLLLLLYRRFAGES